MAVPPAVTNVLLGERDVKAVVTVREGDCAEIELLAVIKFHLVLVVHQFAVRPVPAVNVLLVEKIEAVGFWLVDKFDVVLFQLLGEGLAQSLDDLHLLIGQFQSLVHNV